MYEATVKSKFQPTRGVTRVQLFHKPKASARNHNPKSSNSLLAILTVSKMCMLAVIVGILAAVVVPFARTAVLAPPLAEVPDARKAHSVDLLNKSAYVDIIYDCASDEPVPWNKFQDFPLGCGGCVRAPSRHLS